jgi:5-methylcytosine-specific restriction endonuclease McrA
MTEFVPLRPCGVCRQPVPDGDCPTHPKRGGYRPNRPSVMAGTYGRNWRNLRNRVAAAAGYRCAYCLLDGRTGDHVVPLSKGGRSVPENVVCACSGCNTSKGNRTLREWCDSGRAPMPAIRLLAKRILDELPV